MPIISVPDNPSVNGNTSNSLLFNSLDDEESFVVLERSTANDVDVDINVTATNQPSSTFPSLPNVLSFPSNCSFPVFNTGHNLSTSGMTSNLASQPCQTIPVETLAVPFDSTDISLNVEELEKRFQDLLQENINLKDTVYQTNLVMKQQFTTVSLLQDRQLEVQKKQKAKFEETKALILKLTSEKSELQEAISRLAEEFSKLKEENKILSETNKELKETNIGFGTEAARLLSENDSLKKQVSAVQETLQNLNDQGKKASLQPTTKEIELHELVDQLTRKLEAVERARRQQEFDIDRLTAQLGRATQDLNESQRKLAHAENEIQTVQAQSQMNNNTPLVYSEKVLKYDGLLNQLKRSIEEEQIRFNSLNSWLSMTDPAGNSAQYEISELRRLLAEEQMHSIAKKESLHHAVSMIHELLGDFRKLGEDLERVRADHAVKESHGLAYDEMQKKGFTERLDSLTAKLVEREEALAISERHLASLQEAVRLQNDEKKDTDIVKNLKDQLQTLSKEVAAKQEMLQTTNQELNSLKEEVQKLRTSNETIIVLEEQAKIFQTDFETERRARESVVAEKDRILEDHRHLMRRNQELIDELAKIRTDSAREPVPNPRGNANPRRTEGPPSPPPPQTSQNLTIGNIGPIFHEKQEGNLCAQHCLNALLQGAHFNAVDLAELAEEMDFAEKTKFAEGGVNSKEFESFLGKPSENMDDSGFFSVQVINCALTLWGLEMAPYNSTDPRVIAARKKAGGIKAFICNSHSHWFTIRRLGNQWYNLNSTLKKPEPLSDSYLDLFLTQFQEEGNSVFVVFGDFPPCAADSETPIQEPVKFKSVKDSIVIQNLDKSRGQDEKPGFVKSLNLTLRLRQEVPIPDFGRKLRQYILMLKTYNRLVLQN